MDIVDKILNGKSVRRSIMESEDFPAISDEDLSAVKDVVKAIEAENHSMPFVTVEVKPYGTGFKLILKPNENGLINLENGLNEKLVNDLGWEKIDQEQLNDDTIVSYFR